LNGRIKIIIQIIDIHQIIVKSNSKVNNRKSIYFFFFILDLVSAGFVYAIYENEESVHKILHTCSTKTDRTLDDGRCEYYLDVYSHRSNARRKSVRSKNNSIFLKTLLIFCCLSFPDSNHSMVCGKRTAAVDR